MRLGNGTLFVAPFVLCSVLALQGCAHSALEKQVDDKVAQENTVKNHAELQTQANQMIDSSTSLTAEQKSKLSALRTSTRSQTDQMWEQSLKLRSLLVKDLISSSYNEDEAELIKERIKTLEDQRLTVLFGAVDQANKILGHQAAQNQYIVHGFFYEGHGSRD